MSNIRTTEKYGTFKPSVRIAEGREPMVRTLFAWALVVVASVVAGSAIGFVAFGPDRVELHVVFLSVLTFALLVAIVVRVRSRRKI